MKQSKTCPKCGSKEILRVEGRTGIHGEGNNFYLGRTSMSSVDVPRYVCCSCGYAEEWIDSRDLFRLREEPSKKK